MLVVILFLCLGSLLYPGLCQSEDARKGEVWPEPQGRRDLDDKYFTFTPLNFEFKITNFTCPILNEAMERYQQVLKDLFDVMTRNNVNRIRVLGNRTVFTFSRYQGPITELKLKLKEACDNVYPYFEMDESYYLTVGSSSALLSADSVWGMLRGLETFSQLFYIVDDCSEIQIKATDIFDFPRYLHRGLLINTGRRYISVPNILKTLDAMAMNKLNVFHWHMTDDESFPFQSKFFPELSVKGAFHPSMVYTRAHIQEIVEYARKRGIRVIPEIDVPGHTRSWAASHKELLTECMSLDPTTLRATTIGLGSLNPLKKETFIMIFKLFKEVQSLFPDKYFHIGGDDVDLECWASNPAIQEILTKYKIAGARGLFGMFEKKLIKLLNNGTTAIVWGEVFLLGTDIPEDTVVQVWNSDVETTARMVKGSAKVIVSSGWDLEDVQNLETLYRMDPRMKLQTALNIGKDFLENVIGGETCLWGDKTDDSNLHIQLWPRASAVAEVLWSVTRDKEPMSSVLRRVQEQSCRMRRRGIAADTSAIPGFCFT